MKCLFRYLILGELGPQDVPLLLLKLAVAFTYPKYNINFITHSFVDFNYLRIPFKPIEKGC